MTIYPSTPYPTLRPVAEIYIEAGTPPSLDSKRIAVSRQTGQASFIAPYRNHHGHVRALLQPISSGGRGASDTVLGIIVSVDARRWVHGEAIL
jgi:hypothetical protein